MAQHLVVETSATLYQKNPEQFHVLLTEPAIHGHPLETPTPASSASPASSAVSPSATPPDVPASPRLLWLEISPYRVTMTMQGNGHFSYRHFWEQGIYGLNRYWLQGDRMDQTSQIRLRNFTRSLTLTGHEIPEHLRLEYELWSHHVCLGHYVMNLEIH
ncbi:MAG: hypothetical protein F6K09_10330 [Merismopedia sp. SIO2A8]|nr:hypothetical protein [Merismopedia sp. SIO2A8]